MSLFAKTSLVLIVTSTLVAVALAKDAPPTTAPSTPPTAAVKAEVEKIDVETFDTLRAQAGQIVLDVRTPAEYAEGHVPGAINVPMGKAFEQAIALHDKSTSYLVYCHSGKRSFLATKRMREMGFEHLLNFRGGIVAWEEANKPMVKGSAPHDADAPTTKPAT